MKVVIISDFWTGMHPVVLNNSSRPAGMPAFYNTLVAMNADPRISEIDCHFVGVGDKDGIEQFANSDLNKVNFIVYRYNSKLSLLRKLTRITFEQSKEIKKLGCENVSLYGHGAIGSICGFISKFTGIANTRRVYGTFLVDLMHLSNFKMFLKYPLAFLLFKLPHKNLIVTNDGTHGDRVYKKIHGNVDNLHFLVNGVNKVELLHNPERVLSYVARIDRWKQQHLAIEAFSISKFAKGNYKLKIAGPIYDREYYNELLALITEFGLESQVEVLGPLAKEDAANLLASSSLTFSLYDTSNFGNVFIESLQIGVPILSYNINGSLNFVDEDAYIGINNYDVTHIAERLDEALANPRFLNDISTRSRSFAKTNFASWNERASLEVNILLEG
ncbi:glycosyltransferase family 4 protein [Pseudoalteromonas sp.]|uniref:glycosyltransferase family 4 protein n=1 Tax=Pseudoalteromonas sp. TaxID=53249 RepID=UPI002607891D|nr:glycosyltransferase [Pseudoalteromonas sp.]MCP4588116.1 glycosyltransferase [Pseudoalteromonas sp.]